MKLPDWWTNRLQTDYTPRGLLFRVAADLALSNLGLFVGILTTVVHNRDERSGFSVI